MNSAYTVTKQFFLGVSVAQFLECWPCNPRVGGSKLSDGIRKLFVHHDFHRNYPFTRISNFYWWLVELVCDSITK